MVKTEVAELSAEAAKPALGEQSPEPNKINTATKYRFTGKNLTAYGCGPQKPVRVCRGKPATFRNVRSWATHVEFLELPRCCALLADLVLGCRRPSPTGRRRRTSSGGVGGRKPFPAKAVDCRSRKSHLEVSSSGIQVLWDILKARFRTSLAPRRRRARPFASLCAREPGGRPWGLRKSTEPCAPKMSLRGAALVTMMQSADFRHRNNPPHVR